MTRILIAVQIVLLAGCGSSRPSSEESNAAARAVLDRLVAAAGGDSVLNNVQTLVAQYEFTRTDPGAPTASVEVLQVRDFTNGRNLYEIHAREPNESWERVVMAPGRAFAANMLTGEVNEYDTPSAVVAEYSELQLRWYAYLPITQARTAWPSLRHLGDTRINGREHDVVSFLDDGAGEIRMYVDREESRLRRLSWMTGGTVPRSAALTYAQYETESGLPMPMLVIVSSGTTETARYDIIGIQLNAMLQESAFEPPTSP